MIYLGRNITHHRQDGGCLLFDIFHVREQAHEGTVEVFYKGTAEARWETHFAHLEEDHKDIIKLCQQLHASLLTFRS